MRRSVIIAAACGAAVVAALCAVPLSRDGRLALDAELPEFPSYFMQPQVIDQAFASIGSVSPDVSARMVTVNHHLLAPHLIARTLSVVATSEPVTVVLIAPDHFMAGRAPVTSVIARWPTPFGIIEPDTDAIMQLRSRGVLHLSEIPFYKEHGITNITMFVRRVMPNARLVPIVVRDDASRQSIVRIAEAIASLSADVRVIGSFDFSHDSTADAARKNDARSLDILVRGDPDDAQDISVDSGSGVELLMRLARAWRLRFSMIDASNSAIILDDMSRTDVTSYITGVWVP